MSTSPKPRPRCISDRGFARQAVRRCQPPGVLGGATVTGPTVRARSVRGARPRPCSPADRGLSSPADRLDRVVIDRRHQVDTRRVRQADQLQHVRVADRHQVPSLDTAAGGRGPGAGAAERAGSSSRSPTQASVPGGNGSYEPPCFLQSGAIWLGSDGRLMWTYSSRYCAVSATNASTPSHRRLRQGNVRIGQDVPLSRGNLEELRQKYVVTGPDRPSHGRWTARRGAWDLMITGIWWQGLCDS